MMSVGWTESGELEEGEKGRRTFGGGGVGGGKGKRLREERRKIGGFFGMVIHRTRGCVGPRGSDQSGGSGEGAPLRQA